MKLTQQQQQTQTIMMMIMKRRRIALWLLFTIIELTCIYRYYRNYQKETYNRIQLNHHQSLLQQQQLLLQRQHQHNLSNNNNNNKINHHNHHHLFVSHNQNIDLREFYSNKKLSSFREENVRTTLSKVQSNTNTLDWNSIEVPEPGYPKRTHLVDYSTSATEAEIEKHDRFLVQGMHYMKSFIPREVQHNNNNHHHHNDNNHDEHPPSKTQKMCLNIYLCNRRIPYINSLFMTLTSFSNDESKQQFLESTQVHLLNTEKRKERMQFPYLTNKLSKLPFVHEVHNITYADEIYQNITDRELDFREMFISDTLSGLKICIESGLPYCVMIEEDAVVPVNFISLLQEQVIQPLERKGVLNSTDGSGSISVLSLYSYYNLVFFGPHRLHYSRYAKNKYRDDKAKMNIERWAQGMLPYYPQYQVVNKDYKYGTVAMFYTRQSAIKLVEYLQRVGVNPIHNADEFINADEYFPAEFNVKRKHVMPSLVNHIGYYSERMAAVKSRGMFSQLNTDSRFMYDAGIV